MATDENIDWSQNCMTVGVHNGRDEMAFHTSLSEIELSDGAIYNMVEQAITADAQAWVDHKGYTQEWADRIIELWPTYFDGALKNARENAVHWQQELQKTEQSYGQERMERYKAKRARTTNPSWNDHVTYICRVCGTNASRAASREFLELGKPLTVEGTE